MSLGKRARPPLDESDDDDPGPCTHSMGNVRQDVFVCLTCTVEGKTAGICRACATACHSESSGRGCMLVNLYAKRGFRCDCGNSKMKNSCSLYPEKPEVNESNDAVYSHNFQDRYCRCEQGNEEKLGAMEQCCMCEDWFHHKCLSIAGLTKSSQAKFLRKPGLAYEFICAGCVSKLPILRRYYPVQGYVVSKLLTFPNTFKKKISAPEPDRLNDCILPSLDVSGLPDKKDILWKVGFRKTLCPCSQCEAVYSKANAEFINDLVDIEGQPAEVDEEPDPLADACDEAILNDVLADQEMARKASDPSHAKGIVTESGANQDNLALTSGVESPSGAKLGASDMGPAGVVEHASTDEPSSAVVPAASVAPATVEKPAESAAGLEPASSAKARNETCHNDRDGRQASKWKESEDRLAIQKRIHRFLLDAISKNGADMTREDVMKYVADLKAEIQTSAFSDSSGGNLGLSRST